MKPILLTSLLTMIISFSSRGQGYVNLNFENANIVFVSGSLATSNALPGWSAYLGTNQLSTIIYGYSGGIPPVGLYGSNSLVISGNFSVYIGGYGSISQTGLVPSGSESLLFDATASSYLVSLGGQNLSYTAISTGTNSFGLNYSVYAADISGFAGQTETLSFSDPSGIVTGLDSIQFSSEVVPEPSTICLLFLGGGVLIYVRTRNKKHSAPSKLLTEQRINTLNVKGSRP